MITLTMVAYIILQFNDLFKVIKLDFHYGNVKSETVCKRTYG